MKKKMKKMMKKNDDELEQPVLTADPYEMWVARRGGRVPSWGDVGMDHLEWAWGIIANAGGGNWLKETSDWQEAARAWRDRYHMLLSDWLKFHEQEPSSVVEEAVEPEPEPEPENEEDEGQGLEDVYDAAEKYRDYLIKVHGVNKIKAVELGWMFRLSAQLARLEGLLTDRATSHWDHSRTINIHVPINPDNIEDLQSIIDTLSFKDTLQ